MAQTVAHLPVNPPVPAPDFAAGARVLASLGFTPEDILWIFADTLEIASPLAAAMAGTALAADRGAAAILEAAGS